VAFLFMAGRITSITVQKRNSNRLAIEINGSFAFGLDRLVAAWLNVGQYLSDEEIARLNQKDTEEVLYQDAVRLIGYQARSKMEITNRLEQKGYSLDQILTVVERLEQDHLIDDREYAHNWSENRSQLHPRSHWMVEHEIRKKGIDPEIAAEAVATLKDDRSLALDAGRKSLRRWQGLNQPDFLKKCTSFLARRGFKYDVIRAVLPDLWNELQSL
jgi:regulatory protein